MLHCYGDLLFLLFSLVFTILNIASSMNAALVKMQILCTTLLFIIILSLNQYQLKRQVPSQNKEGHYFKDVTKPL